MAGWCRAVGMELHELEVGDGHPARSAMAIPSPVDSGGLVVTEKSWPAPPVASSVWPARSSTARRAAGEGHHAPAAAALDDQVEGEPSFHHGAGRRSAASTSARSTSAPVAAPPAWTTRAVEWPPSRASASGRVVAVERGAEGGQLAHPGRAFVDQDAHRVASHRPAPAAGCRRGASRPSPRRAPSTAATPPWAHWVADSARSPLVSTPTRSAGDRPPGRRRHRGRQAGDPAARRPGGRGVPRPPVVDAGSAAVTLRQPSGAVAVDGRFARRRGRRGARSRRARLLVVGVGDDDHLVAGVDQAGGRAVEAHLAGPPEDGVGLEAGAVVDVEHGDLLVLEDVGRRHRSGSRLMDPM